MRYFFSLGSNLGDPYFYMKKMEEFLEKTLDSPIIRSSLMETTPVDVTDVQKIYLNRIVVGESQILPLDMLKLCQKEELSLGRTNKGAKLARTADIDILFAGNQIINSDVLTIPHPAICERLFILKGLQQTDNTFVHPLLKKSISLLYSEIAEKLKDQEITIIK